MFETSVIEISKEALHNNLNFIRERVGSNARLCSVVKGNAYGHSLPEFVKLAMEFGIDYFAVYSADEAYRLVTNLEVRPDIYVMGAVDGPALEWAITEGVECSIFNFERLENALEIAARTGKKAKIHLEIETGMNRTGFATTEITKLSQVLQENSENIELKGLCTHFAGAESMANDFRVKKQMLIYKRVAEQLYDLGLKPQYYHISCSAAIMNYPHTICNMVRVGIMQYGYWPNMETYIRYSGGAGEAGNPLRRVIRWSSKVMALKNVRKGEFIGYGTSYMSRQDMQIAVVPVGYAHGYNRSLSNAGKVLIRGEEAPVTGTVNMNVISVDVTHIPEVAIDDEVVLIGKQENKAITVASFGEMSEQLNYELLIRLPQDIPRIVVD